MYISNVNIETIFRRREMGVMGIIQGLVGLVVV